jgi:Ran GTPase-activating protein (RanGAP) involved in mRNA processing and transport
MIIFGEWKATRPHDKAYALSGLAQEQLAVDYTKSSSDLYKDICSLVKDQDVKEAIWEILSKAFNAASEEEAIWEMLSKAFNVAGGGQACEGEVGEEEAGEEEAGEEEAGVEAKEESDEEDFEKVELDEYEFEEIDPAEIKCWESEFETVDNRDIY